MTKLFIILALVAIGASVGHAANNTVDTYGPQAENKTKAAATEATTAKPEATEAATAKPASCKKLDENTAEDAKKICAAVGDILDVMTGCQQTTKATCVGGCVWSGDTINGKESTTNGICSRAKDLTAVKEHKGKFTSCNVNAGSLLMQGLEKKCKDIKAKTECVADQKKGCRWEISHYDKRERNKSSRGIATEHVCKVDVMHAFKINTACGVNDTKKALKYMKATDKFNADSAKKALAQKNKELAKLKKFKSQNCGANKTAAYDTLCNSNAQDLNVTEADVAAIGEAVEGYELLAKSSAAIPDPTSEPTATTKPRGVPAGAAAHSASLIMALFVAAAAALAM